MRLGSSTSLLVFTALLAGCQERPITTTAPDALLNATSTSAVFVVSPSGDPSGVTDANNIQDALNAAKANGDAVYLTDGDAATVDHYYVSRNIVVGGFWGTLMGEGMDKTIIEAVRMSEALGDGFSPAASPYWPETFPDLPTVLQLDYSAGDVTIRDLTVQVGHPNPVDPYLHPWLSGAPPTTAISTLIEILGGDHNTTVENVRLKGAPGDARGTNLLAGIHVMLGDAPTPGDVGTGDLTFKNVVAEDMIYGLNVMRFEWSAIKIEDATATNVGTGVDVEGVFDSSVEISNAEIAVRPQGRAGIYLWVIPSGLAVTGNTVTGSPAVGAVYMNNTSNATIAGNTIKDVEVGQWWRAPMYLWRSDDNTISGNHFEAVSGGMAGIRLRAGSSGNALEQNHFVLSGLPGWTATTPYGPGAVMLDASTYGNAVFEMMFPPREGIARCQMIWDMTDDPGTTEYDGANEIHNWQPCENLAERVARKAEADSEPEPGFPHWH